MGKIAIIGAGISGLTCGYTLMQKKYDNFEIFESSNRPGGVIKTFKNTKYLFEEGPNTFAISDNRTLRMIMDLNLNIIKPKKSSSSRYILKNNSPTPLPSSLISIINTKLISKKTKIKIFQEIFNKSDKKDDNESIHDFFTRRFNNEIADYLVNPFIAGTFSGDPKKISIKHAFPKLVHLEKKYKSLILGFLIGKKPQNAIKREVISFQNGLSELTKSLSIKLNDKINYNSKVNSISAKSSGFIINVMQNGKSIEKFVDKIIITCPCKNISEIIKDERITGYIKKIKSINYPPLDTFTLAYNKNDIPNIDDGFGLLVPEVEKKNILGILYLSSMFKYRAPKNEILMTVFVGGARHPEMTKLNSNKILEIIKTDLSDIYGIQSDPKFVYHRKWPQSIPQYSLDYDTNLNSFTRIEKILNGIHFTGNYKGGISIENNILNAMKLVNKIIN